LTHGLNRPAAAARSGTASGTRVAFQSVPTPGASREARTPMTIPTPARTVSVLLVEDHRDIAFSLACFFRLGAGYDVRVATDGAEGVRFALEDPPDAVVCDIGLPKQNGLLVVEELAERLPRRPLFIAVTGYGDAATRDLAREAGFDHFLTKPADPFALQDLIEAHARTADVAAG
jgi:DNA-binding response OmpR family regulator